MWESHALLLRVLRGKIGIFTLHKHIIKRKKKKERRGEETITL